jgi:TRAP-type C4-dicarboxylate transport system permease small subunit
MKIVKWIDEKLEEVFLIAILAAMVVLIFTQIVMRYVFSNSLTWSEELARYMFLWIIWVGASYATKKKSHIAIAALTSRLPKMAQNLLAILVYLIWLGFCLFLVIKGGELTDKIFTMQQESAALRIPMGFAYASVPVGSGLMMIRLLQNGYQTLRNKNKEVA